MPRFARILLLPLALLVAGGIAGGDPLTEEEIVRMFVAGATSEEMVREIESREPELDVSPEMLDELRQAGLPRAVIDAMVRRQRLADNARRAQEASEQAGTNPVLRIVFDTSQSVSVAGRIDPQLAAEWELGNAPEERTFADVALYVACHTGDHVPNQWRNKSPLGRDFSSMRRHRLLEFVTATTGKVEDERPAGRRVKLQLPAEIEIPLEPGIAHDITLGLAVQIGGRYRRVTDDKLEGLVLEEGGLEIEAKVRGREPTRFRVRFAEDGDEEDDESPDDGVFAP
jgi:hypothetical protein